MVIELELGTTLLPKVSTELSTTCKHMLLLEPGWLIPSPQSRISPRCSSVIGENLDRNATSTTRPFTWDYGTISRKKLTTGQQSNAFAKTSMRAIQRNRALIHFKLHIKQEDL